jgi:hypothetical protein
VPAVGVTYINAEVEPTQAINPTNSANIVAAWQQDRWSTGGSRGIVAGASGDGGKTWAQHVLGFSRCGGGSDANGGDYERASDPWLSVAPDGTMHLIAIAFSGGVMQPGSVSAVVASRSTDGGATWSTAHTLIRDAENSFNDKCTITADPVTPHYIYAVWDRLVNEVTGPTMLARSVDDGQTWDTPRAIYDPGANSQTISNAIVVLPNGMLVNLFLELHSDANGNIMAAYLQVIRSADNGQTWSTPSRIAELLAVGTKDPDTGARVRDATLVPQMTTSPGGVLNVVWQDARFSSGARDGIALAHSTDGGMSWSAPVQVNGAPAVAAFVPSIHVRSDGEVGVTYYDFRDNTGSATTLLTDYWLARSGDGVTWHESQVAAPFDLDLAPADASGRFLGDYQALSSIGNVFVPLFARTNGNTTDMFVAPQVSATTTLAVKAYRVVVPSATVVVTPEWRVRVNENLAAALREGPPGKD